MTPFLYKAQKFSLDPIFQNPFSSQCTVSSFKAYVAGDLPTDSFTLLLAEPDAAAEHISSPWSSLCCMVGMFECQLCTYKKKRKSQLCFHWKLSKDSMQAWVFLFKSYLHKTAQICQVINKVKQLTDVISDGGTVWIHPLKMLLIHFANTWKRDAGFSAHWFTSATPAHCACSVFRCTVYLPFNSLYTK